MASCGSFEASKDVGPRLSRSSPQRTCGCWRSAPCAPRTAGRPVGDFANTGGANHRTSAAVAGLDLSEGPGRARFPV